MDIESTLRLGLSRVAHDPSDPLAAAAVSAEAEQEYLTSIREILDTIRSHCSAKMAIYALGVQQRTAHRIKQLIDEQWMENFIRLLRTDPPESMAAAAENTAAWVGRTRLRPNILTELMRPTTTSKLFQAVSVATRAADKDEEMKSMARITNVVLHHLTFFVIFEQLLSTRCFAAPHLGSGASAAAAAAAAAAAPEELLCTRCNVMPRNCQRTRFAETGGLETAANIAESASRLVQMSAAVNAPKSTPGGCRDSDECTSSWCVLCTVGNIALQLTNAITDDHVAASGATDLVCGHCGLQVCDVGALAFRVRPAAGTRDDSLLSTATLYAVLPEEPMTPARMFLEIHQLLLARASATALSAFAATTADMKNDPDGPGAPADGYRKPKKEPVVNRRKIDKRCMVCHMPNHYKTTCPVALQRAAEEKEATVNMLAYMRLGGGMQRALNLTPQQIARLGAATQRAGLPGGARGGGGGEMHTPQEMAAISAALQKSGITADFVMNELPAAAGSDAEEPTATGSSAVASPPSAQHTAAAASVAVAVAKKPIKKEKKTTPV
jgi:hypothetical protein